jgi:hypothetical protein
MVDVTTPKKKRAKVQLITVLRATFSTFGGITLKNIYVETCQATGE